MADNQEAIELQRRARRRLVGAIALVVFVVIVLPIIFDREPKPISQDLTIQIPSQDAGRFETRVLPATEPKAAPQSLVDAAAKSETSKPVTEGEKPAPAASTPPVAATTAVGQDKPGAVDKGEKAAQSSESAKAGAPLRPDAIAQAKSDAANPAAAKSDVAKAEVVQSDPAKSVAAKADASKQPAAKAAAVPAKADAAAGVTSESFVIPLGLFRNPENVKKVRGWVASAGFKSFTEAAPDTESGKGSAVKVKVMAGPFPSRDAADRAHEKLKARGVDVGAVASR